MVDRSQRGGGFWSWLGQRVGLSAQAPVAHPLPPTQGAELGEWIAAVSEASPGLHILLDVEGIVLSARIDESCVRVAAEMRPGLGVLAQLATPIRELIAEAIERTRFSGQLQALELELGPVAQLFTCALRIVPVRGGRLYLCGRDDSARVARDHEERLLQEQLRRLHRMEALGQLAGGVAHDYNNLLTVISGHAELLRAQLPAGSPGLEDLERIEAASVSAAGLTRRLLDFSRSHVLHPVSVELNSMIGNMQRLIGRLLREDVTLELRLAEDLRNVHVDPGSIEQVLISLADNAAHAMPTGGHFRISTANVTLGPADLDSFERGQAGDFVELSLSDTGCGMSPEVRRRAFEPFFTTKSAERGTGLGLTSVAKILERSHALVQIQSEEGKGTTFRILFPVALAAHVLVPDESSLVPQSSELRGTETLLLCEDDDAVREVLADSLLGAGYSLLVASSAEEALRIEDAHEDVLQLLVTDLVMPNKTGAQLALELRERRPGLRVLFVSGHAAEVVRSHGTLTAEDSLLPKPFTPRELLHQVRELLDQRESLARGR